MRSARSAGVLLMMPLAAWGSDLESAVARAMEGHSGAAVVAEAATGRILAAWRPEVARLRAASPGSTLKPFTLQAWIETHGSAGPPRMTCPRRLRLGERRLDCTHPVLASPLDAAGALAYSCNCYFARLALDLRPAEFARALRRLAGAVSTATREEELQMQAIGEWGIRMTPMELLTAYRRLAAERRNPALAPVFAGLEGAVAYGSAQLATAPGLRIAGKTGTSLTHAWFAGFTPEVLVVVFLEQGRGGSEAAPVAGEIFRAWRAAAP
jgi:cell division protein FtsI/penicillin-binding protein 2